MMNLRMMTHFVFINDSNDPNSVSTVKVDCGYLRYISAIKDGTGWSPVDVKMRKDTIAINMMSCTTNAMVGKTGIYSQETSMEILDLLSLERQKETHSRVLWAHSCCEWDSTFCEECSFVTRKSLSKDDMDKVAELLAPPLNSASKGSSLVARNFPFKDDVEGIA